jgi:hypothetical protein
MINQNYCWVDINKIYMEIYDDLLDEDLSMNNKDHNDKIKFFLEKKILNSSYISLSESFTLNDDIISDLILKITSKVSNSNLQGNTVLMFAGSNEMYELFHMEDLTKPKHPDCDLNELASMSNIQLLPIYWGCGIFKTIYDGNLLKGSLIAKKDLAKLFIQNYYHIGVMIGTKGDLLEIEFTGEDPFKVIGTNYSQAPVTNIIGFNMIPWIEKTNEYNELGSKLLGKDINGRLFLSLLCPTTNKKFWDINIETIKNILTILDDENLFKLTDKELELTDKDINPFFVLNKILSNK